MYLKTHPKFLKGRQHVSHNLFIIGALLLPRNWLMAALKPMQGSFCCYLYFQNYCLSRMLRFVDRRTVKIPHLQSFSFLILANLLQRYAKQCPCLFKAFTNCLIRPRRWWRWWLLISKAHYAERLYYKLHVKWWCQYPVRFYQLCVLNVLRARHKLHTERPLFVFFSMQCSLSALLSDYRRNRAILFSVWPPCWPSSIPVSFRLSHTNQLYSAYLIFLRSTPCFHKYLLQQQQQLFYGPLSGTTRVSRYQKKRSPTHHPDHHPIFISFFHLPRSIASSLFKLRALQSFCTSSFHVLFGLPLGLGPSTSHSIHFFTQSVSSFRSTWPYHRSLFCCSINIISSIPSLFLNSLLGTLSFTLTLHVHGLTVVFPVSRGWWVAAMISLLSCN